METSQKLFRPVACITAEALEACFFDQRYADKVIEYQMKRQKKWGARDRKLFAEATYDIVRWARRLARNLGQDWSPGQEVPEGESTSSWCWKLLGVWWFEQGFGPPPPWDEFFEIRKYKSRPKEVLSWPRAVRESIPDWLDELGAAELKSWDEELSALNQQAPVFLRTNKIKISRDELLAKLIEEGFEAEAYAPLETAIRLKQRANVFTSESFKSGHFEVQDAASQRIAPFLDPQPGERLVDACAGAGGKSLHLAERMQNKGQILALDIHEWKLNELKKRARRAGVHNIETRVIESTKVIKRLEKSADRLLLDVPCSGLGVLRRNPDSKWKLSQNEMTRLKELQANLLQSYSLIVKPRGIMVYATCSLMPSENENQIKAFLEHQSASAGLPQWELEEQMWVRPSEGDEDGFFAARLRRLS